MNRYIFGEWRSGRTPLTAEDAAGIMDLARRRADTLAGYPEDRILEVFGGLSRLWKDPEYHLRKKAAALLPAEAGVSRQMIELGLSELGRMLDPDLIRVKMRTELRGIPGREDRSYSAASGRTLRWEPLGTVLYVLSGNVFLVCAGSLIEGFATRNASVIKVSSSGTVFPELFIRSLIEADPEGVVSGSAALVDFSSAQKEVMAEFKKRADCVAVWGGEEAVKAYRNDLPARTRLVVFGPKLSLALVTKGGFEKHGARALAEKLAFEMSIWDQRACTAPQICYVEGRKNAAELLEALAPALAAASRKIPPGKIDAASAAEIRKVRTVFEIAEARGAGVLKESRSGLDWTAALDRDLSLDFSPLHRTIRVVPFERLEQVAGQLLRFRGYIQTVGAAVSLRERESVSARLRKCGALRIVALGKMAGGEIDDPHDGAYDLPQLMNLVIERLPSREGIEPADSLSVPERKAVVDSRLRALLRQAARSPFYAKRLGRAGVMSVDDLPRIPVLTRKEMEENMPPQGFGLYTGVMKAGGSAFPAALSGGYVSRSGGSTGAPKFSIYDGRDWDEMIGHAVRVLRACGLREGDRLANCFMAGDLYGSFVSFDHINSRLGVLSFAFATAVSPEVFVEVWRKFSLNAVQGVPATIMPLLRKAKELEPRLRLEKVIFAGAPLSRSDRDWLRSRLGADRVASVIGANDGGQIAYQCAALEGNAHHLADDFNFVEILGPAGERVPDGEAGRIVITSLLKYSFPLIRYEIGDRGRIIPGKCECGRTARMLEFLGRSGDDVSVGCMNVNYADIRKALDGLPFSELQIAARSSAGGDILAVRAEAPAPAAGLKERIYAAMIKAMPVIKDRLRSGKLHRLEVEIAASGGLQRNPRSVKVKSVVDERIKG